MMGTLYCQQAPSFGWDVKPRSWLSVVIKNPMALLVKEALSLCLLFICSWCVVSALAPLSCGSLRNNPPHPRTVSPWDLSTVLRALKGSPFEPLQSTSLRALSFKTALLLALASVKRVGDLQASSINPVCLEFGPNDSKVVLKPRLGYVSKVLSTPFRAQVIALSALSPSTGSQELSLLCPIRALRVCIEHFAS